MAQAAGQLSSSLLAVGVAERTARSAAPTIATWSRRARSRGLQLFDFFAPGMVSDWVRRHTATAFGWSIFSTKAVRSTCSCCPDLLWDNRAPVIERLWEVGVHRVGIFHDAIALRRPGQSRIDSYLCERGVRALAELDAVVCISHEAEEDLIGFWHRFRRPARGHLRGAVARAVRRPAA